MNRHQVVECEKSVMKEHVYWPVVSDLINLLSHKTVSQSFLQQSDLCARWMELLTSLQGRLFALFVSACIAVLSQLS
jgi:E3 ubiquitin-protein ligase UBR3